ncbi:hypothetical protein ACFLTH_03695 [Bacteroidota bacterium]
MKSIIILLIVTGTIFSQTKIYNNSKLGISFDYTETDYSPFGLVYDSSRTNSLSDWKSFTSGTLGISFRYPENMLSIEEKLDSFYGESINDSSVQLGYRNTLDSSIFYAVVIIYRSNKAFEEIAHDLFFEKVTSEYYSDWVILGRGGMDDAMYFEGKNCKGLRGQTFVGFYHCEGGYAGLGDIYRTLLVFDINNEKIVLFYDSAGATDCLEKEGVPNDDLWEDEFYIIASTIEIKE